MGKRSREGRNEEGKVGKKSRPRHDEVRELSAGLVVENADAAGGGPSPSPSPAPAAPASAARKGRHPQGGTTETATIQPTTPSSGEGGNGGSSAIIRRTVPTPAFFRRRVRLAMSLLPSSLRNCDLAVEYSIRKKLLRYSGGFGGILIAYDDVQLRDEADDNNSRGRGWILNELPHVHYNVSCRVLVFAPHVGCEVRLFGLQKFSVIRIAM
jgi:hypothetical protein